MHDGKKREDREEETISYQELDFFLDVRRGLVRTITCINEPKKRRRPRLFVDLDSFFDDKDAMMA